jgi:hypothetical protein
LDWQLPDGLPQRERLSHCRIILRKHSLAHACAPFSTDMSCCVDQGSVP